MVPGYVTRCTQHYGVQIDTARTSVFARLRDAENR
jgi:hypothetical protein